MKPITIGADPEFFIYNKNKIISAVGIVEGTKEEPFYINETASHIQRDNVSLEININPSSNKDVFRGNCNSALMGGIQYLKNKNPDYDICTDKSSLFFSSTELEDPRANIFGCDKDYDCWFIDTPKSTIDKVDAGTFRTCGGHVHIGFSGEVNPETMLKTAKSCDLYLGLPSLLFDRDKDRRRLYGQAGSFRPKPYGIEYRVLSNFWLQSNAHINWIFKAACKAYKNRDYIGHRRFNIIKTKNEIRDTINSYDVEKAVILLAEFGFLSDIILYHKSLVLPEYRDIPLIKEHYVEKEETIDFETLRKFKTLYNTSSFSTTSVTDSTNFESSIDTDEF